MKSVYTFVGNCGDSPIVKTTPSGQTVMEVRVANNVGYGEKQTTYWVRVTMFGERGKKLANYISKGQEVFVSGDLTINEYFTNDGNKKFGMNVVAHTFELSGKRISGESNTVENSSEHLVYNPNVEESNDRKNVLDDLELDIPF